MPPATPLPRKFLNCLEETQGQLRLIGQRARIALSELETQRGPFRQTQVILRDIEAAAYRLALELSELEIASGCDECPTAPARTSAQIHLLLLADELEAQAEKARCRAKQP